MAPKRKWTKQEEEILKQMTAEKQPNEIIAEKIDRTVVALEQRQKKLGIIEPPKGRRWTEEEDFDLRFYHAEGETYEQIAERLGRSAASVSQRLSGFKKDKKPSVAKPSVAWTSDEERTLTEMYEQGKDDQAIAEQLGRTIYSVASRRSKLGLKNKRWTKGEEAEIMRLKGMELSWEEISLALNKTISSVQNRYEELISIAEETDIKRKKHKPEPYTGPSITDISLEAQKQGMSYGQYVAMQYEREAMQSNAK